MTTAKELHEAIATLLKLPVPDEAIVELQLQGVIGNYAIAEQLAIMNERNAKRDELSGGERFIMPSAMGTNKATYTDREGVLRCRKHHKQVTFDTCIDGCKANA